MKKSKIGLLEIFVIISGLLSIVFIILFVYFAIEIGKQIDLKVKYCMNNKLETSYWSCLVDPRVNKEFKKVEE